MDWVLYQKSYICTLFVIGTNDCSTIEKWYSASATSIVLSRLISFLTWGKVWTPNAIIIFYVSIDSVHFNIILTHVISPKALNINFWYAWIVKLYISLFRFPILFGFHAMFLIVTSHDYIVSSMVETGPVILELFWGRRWKCEEFTRTATTATDNGLLIRKAHLSIQLSWATHLHEKNSLNLCIKNVKCCCIF